MNKHVHSDIEHIFMSAVQDLRRQDEKAAAARRNAQLSSLIEEIRHLLVEAAYVELALATKRELFDEVLPLDFSNAVYHRLKRHKVPFAGALKVVGTDLPRPRPDDALFIRLRESKKTCCCDALKPFVGKLGDRLRELINERNHPPSVSSDALTARPTIVCYGV
jgi:hypothetical protein